MASPGGNPAAGASSFPNLEHGMDTITAKLATPVALDLPTSIAVTLSVRTAMEAAGWIINVAAANAVLAETADGRDAQVGVYINDARDSFELLIAGTAAVELAETLADAGVTR